MRWLRNGLTIAAVVLTLSGTAFADPVQFASFTQAIGANLPFRFVNAGANSVFGLYDEFGQETSIIVNFQYQTANGLGIPIGQNFNAKMTFTSKIDGDVQDLGDFLRQPMKEVIISFRSLVDDSNLLTVTQETSGRLQGDTGSSTAGYAGTELVPGPGPNTVRFTSDYLDFSGAYSNQNYSISLANVQPILAKDGNTLRSFNSSAAGTFGRDPLPPSQNRVPEPMTGAFVAVGILACGMVRRRRK